MPIPKKSIMKATAEAKKNSQKRNFMQAIDLILVLQDIDLKRPENRINELVELPHPPKSEMRIIVFASGDLALRAEKAGADMILQRGDIDRFVSDKKGAKKLARDADFFLAETTLMAAVGKVLGPLLGPRGKMPTPVPPIAPINTIIERLRKTVRVRIRDQLNAQVSVGTEVMDDEMIADNVQTVVVALEQRLERGQRNIRSAYIKTTMGSPVKIEV